MNQIIYNKQINLDQKIWNQSRDKQNHNWLMIY